ncbi:hypothetical protein ACHAPJ_004352 [Fusarium lateritium]
MFSPFPRLPPEIRHQIWQNTLDTPGMHFLKVEPDWHPVSALGRWWTKDSRLFHLHSDDEDEDIDPVALEVKRESQPTAKVYATLQPLYPTRQADISHYTNVHQQLAKLSATCHEAASIAKSLTSRPSTFRSETGRIISLDASSDVIYLEYVPPDVYEDNIRFCRALSCPGLDQIRRVAVRYCHKWYERQSSTRCPSCGQIHQTLGGVKYPNHLYRFLAQYLPNLEQFYFVDYLILRKSSSAQEESATDGQGGVKAKPPMCRFESGNRRYFEANEQDWRVQSRVFQVKSWLQEQFIKYAKASKLSKHKNPEQVKFSVLACEWNVGPPSEPKKIPVTPVKKVRNTRTHHKGHALSSSRQLLLQKGSTPVLEPLPSDLTSSFSFVFDARGDTRFDFTFSIPL